MKQHASQCHIERWYRKPEYVGPRECNCDGYHTFDELYEHRIALFIALCRMDTSWGIDLGQATRVWRSKLHADGGSSFDGWFVLGIHKEKGKQITYHLPNAKWDEVSFAETLERAPEWDGHTADDVLERLKKI